MDFTELLINSSARKHVGILGRDFYNINIITCHLGNGSSVAAIKKGQINRYFHGIYASGRTDDGHPQRGC